MQNSRDQLHAHQFNNRRLASALMLGDAGGAEAPMRRPTVGTVIGLCLTVLTLGGFFVFGLFVPGGNTAWRTPGTIVLEKETGTRYVFRDGVLRPAANLASARLYAGTATKMVTVSRNSLAGVPRGASIGTSGAPELLPEATSLATTAGLLCADPSGTRGLALVLDPAVAVAPMADGDIARVVGPDGKEYLVHGLARYPLPGRDATVALGIDGVDAVPVSQALLDMLVEGVPVVAPGQGELGRPAPGVAGAPGRVGDLVTVTGAASPTVYMVMADGLLPLSPTEAALASIRAGKVRAVGVADVAAMARATAPQAGRVPDLLGHTALRVMGRQLCLPVDEAERASTGHLLLVTGLPGNSDPQRATVVVPQGGGLLATAKSSTASRTTPPKHFLINEVGVRYPIRDDAALGALGYQASSARVVPDQVLALVAGGPVLARPSASGDPDGGQ